MLAQCAACRGQKCVGGHDGLSRDEASSLSSPYGVDKEEDVNVITRGTHISDSDMTEPREEESSGLDGFSADLRSLSTSVWSDSILVALDRRRDST